MSDANAARGHGDSDDSAPGDSRPEGDSLGASIGAYGVGLALAAVLTAAAFLMPMTGLIYGPSLPWLLLALAVAQIGVHLTFFLHLTTAPDNTNNIMALLFGTFIVILVIGGSVWIMGHLNGNMMPAGRTGMGM